jgi:diadenylate cyclase
MDLNAMTEVKRSVFMENFMDIFANMRLADILDILIVSFFIYKFTMLVKETRAEQLVKGLIILLIASKLSEYAQLTMIHFLLKNTMTIGVVALLIVFQPELRKALEYIGRSKVFGKSNHELAEEETDSFIDEMVKTCEFLSKHQIGGLMVIIRDTGLNDIAATGHYLDAVVTEGLLTTIFFPNTALHDGAVLIKGNRVLAAGCLLPLSENQNISKSLGTRHRAALGLVEKTDSIVIIVSEETGVISIAMEGKLSRYLDQNALRSILRSKLKTPKKQGTSFISFGRAKRDE